MNEYKGKSSLIVISDPNDERMGAALSRGLAGTPMTEPEPCPGAEEIAAVVEGTAPTQVRDRLLKHISACTACYKSFMLTVELHKEEEEESKEDKHKIIFLKPLALAASVLIVVFTAYLLFRTGGIPKTPGDLLEQSEALKESSERLRQPAEMSYQAKSKEVAETDARGLSVDKKAAQKEDKKLKHYAERPAPPAPLTTSRVEDSRMEELKALERDAAAVAAPEPVTGRREEQEKTKDAELGAVKSQVTVEPAKGGVSQSITRSAAAKSETVADEAGKNRLDGFAGQKDIPFQQQAVILNQQVRQINNYVPQEELDDLFNNTILLSQQMVKEVEVLNKEAAVSQDFNKMNSYVDELKPLIKVTVEADTVYIFPDVEWFFSRSDPGSLEYRFFSLARSGWCVTNDLCTAGKIGRPEAQKLLPQWQELEPQLTGIFKQIAAWTISHLTTEK